MDHSFCVGSHLYGLFKILFDLIQCWLWVGCGLVFQMGFPYIPDNAVQIIMKDMAVKIVLLYLTQFQRPHIQIIFSRCVFFKNGLPGSFQNQIHLVHPHISDLVNKDFHINHQPQKIWMSRQFTKQAVVISTAAGSGTKSANKDIADSMFFWGVPKTYRYGVNVRATNYSGVTDELKKKIDKKTTSIANKVKKNNGKVKAGLKTKGFFFIMRMIQKSGWNEADKNYWAERGWNGKNRPWKNT